MYKLTLYLIFSGIFLTHDDNEIFFGRLNGRDWLDIILKCCHTNAEIGIAFKTQLRGMECKGGDWIQMKFCEHGDELSSSVDARNLLVI